MNAELPADAEAPQRIGPYQILRLLGEGGMGRVWLAREDAVQREVALKVIGGANASSEFHQRFQREIELLAALEHPGIARLYAAGSAQTATGRVPYLAMEYVRGDDLLTHARQAGLDLDGKLRLVALIARAVHHAHTRGVIHRDLKPGNILVDEHGAPKILDFGVAHVTGRDDLPQMTVAGEVLGTVPYMPLEQLGGESRQVDPRWDVYALGVIAYELLSGELPYPGLSKATVLSALKEVLSGTPVRLSKRLPAARGDVETIITKAMAAEPAQRYASAAELAADLERYLARRPIEARPPTVRYVLGLFVRRHRALTAGAALAVVALLAATLISLRYGLAEAEAHRQAELRAAERDAVNQFLERMLTSADPDQSRGTALTVLEVLGTARAALGAQDLAPEVAGTLHRTIGNTYFSLGRAEEGLQLLTRARELAVQTDGAGSPRAQQAELSLAVALVSAGRHTEAEKLLESLRTMLAPAGGSPVGERVRALAHLYSAKSLAEQGQFDAAMSAADIACAETERLLGPRDMETLSARRERARIHAMRGEMAKALEAFAELVERARTALGEDHPTTLDVRNERALGMRYAGDNAAAEREFRDILARDERVLGARHPSVLAVRNNLFMTLAAQERHAEAQPIGEVALVQAREVLGASHATTLAIMNNLAFVYDGLGQPLKSGALYEELLPLSTVAQGADHPDTLLRRSNRAVHWLENDRRAADAERELAAVHARALEVLGPDHPQLAWYGYRWASALRALHRAPEARALLENSLAVLNDKLGPDHPRTRKAAALLAELGVAA